MPRVHPSKARGGGERGYLALILLVFLAVHGLLVVHDVATPDAFVAGDRAKVREEKMRYLLDGYDAAGPFRYLIVEPGGRPSFVGRLIEVGSPGDYVIHAAAYALGGSAAVVALQLALALVASLCVYVLAGLVGLTSRFAFIAAIVYTLLPGSLMQPHTLVTEALYNPLVVIALTLTVRNVEAEFRNGLFCLALAALALAIFVRLQLLLYPFLLAAILAVADPRRWLARAVPIMLIAVLPPLAWMGFHQAVTGEFAMGRSDHSLGHNFFATAARLARIGGHPFDAEAYPGEEMSIAAFAGAVLEHPALYLRLKASEFANLFLNPGVYAFAAHYLGIFPLVEDLTYWKQIRDREGVGGVIVEIVRWGPGFAATFLAAVAAWGVFLICMAIGLIAFLRGDRPSAASKAILLGYLAYGALIVQLSSGVRWTHRTSFEFVMVLLFAAGLEAVARWRARSP